MERKKTGFRPRQLLALTLLLLVVPVVIAEAKVTGKISGMVSDGKSGKPVVGATVRVNDTELATKTDEDGEYFIISVPVGRYDLTVSHVGFEKITKKEVRVLVDLTTPVDFEVSEVAVELPNPVVVYATAPVIQKDLTASRVIFTEERLRNLPNISSVQTILTNYPGVVVGRDEDLHIRGGRSGQVSYYYDGFSVQDPFTATAGIRIMPTALEELSLTSGGFTAEYGEAQSGVVSAVTREGTSEYRGKLRMFQGATNQYDVNSGDWGGLKAVANRSVAFNYSGPIPGTEAKKYNFFTAAEYLRDDGYLPHNWQTIYTGTAKISMRPANHFKIKTNVTYSESDGGAYQHRDVNGRSYDFNLDGQPIWERKSYLAGVSGNYAFSERAVFTLSLNRFFTKRMLAPAHLMGTYWRDWPGYSEDANGDYNGTIHVNNYGNNPDHSDPMQITGFTVGDDFDPTYAYRETQYNSIVASFINQIDKVNQLKAGLEFRRYQVMWDFKQFYNTNPYGEQYSSKPTRASFYLEDKIEYRTFVINAGLRYDYNDADISYNYTPNDTIARYRKSESKSRFSPRLGVSFPIGTKSVVHFNYGMYFQVPRYVYLYTNLQGDRTTGLPLFGNPDLEPEQTVSYELGLDQLIGKNLRMDLTAYYKDVSDLVSTRSIGTVAAGQPLTKFTNDDYGSVTGFDLALELLPGESNFSGSISYGFMIAKGNGSDALEPYYTFLTSNTDTLAPVTEFPLDFDQRHTVTAVLDYRVPRDWKGNLFGLQVPGAWGLSMVGYFGSGLPYSRTDSDGNRLGERNESRLPATRTVDMRFNKDFFFGKVAQAVTFFVEVDNIFDERNVLDVYTRTGLADNDGQQVGAGLSLDAEDLSRYDRLYDNDPQNYSPPRTIRTGFEFSF